jgi:hypothetical protein
MQERLREIIQYQIEAYGGKINPKDDFSGFIFDILQLFRDEIKSLRVKYADYEGQAWNSALDSVLKKLEGKGEEKK